MKTGSYVENLVRAIEHVRSTVTECSGKCNAKAALTIRDTNGKCYPVCCPLLSRDCMRGRSYVEQARQHAMRNMPKGIPARYKEELPHAYETLALDRVAEWNKQGVMYICGATGSGKSFAAAWCVYNLLLERVTAEWDKPYKWGELCDFQTSWFSAYQVTLERANLSAAVAAGLLVLDDLGAESSSPNNKATILELIGQRYNNKAPTIITSNLTVTEMLDRYSQRFYDRVMQGGWIVDTGDTNRRIRQC